MFLGEFFSHCFIIQAINNYRYGYVVAVVILSLLAIRLLKWLDRFRYVDNLDQRCILVTGCDSGFGEKLCIKLDKFGCIVFACCMSKKGIENLRNLCSNNVMPFLLDIRDSSNIQSVTENVKKALKGRRLWGVVNNAGICGVIGPVELLRKEDFKEILDVNFLGGVDLIINTLPLMKADSRERARIVNMTSILGTFHTPYSSPYCVSKCALNTFSYILSIELTSSNIDVIVIEPGAHLTNFVSSIDTSISTCWERLTEDERNRYGKSNFRKIILLGSTFLKIFTSGSLDGVIDAYCHALFSKRPHRRYIIGLDATLMNITSYIPKPVLSILYMFPGLLAISPK